MPDETRLPTDEYSRMLSRLQGHPEAIDSTSTIETADFYGNSETWIVKTLRVSGDVTVFVQRISADVQPLRVVIPPVVTAAMARHRDSILDKGRKRAARKAAATREARGIEPGFLKARKNEGGDNGIQAAHRTGNRR